MTFKFSKILNILGGNNDLYKVRIFMILLFGLFLQISMYSQEEDISGFEVSLTNQLVDSLGSMEDYGLSNKRNFASNIYLIHQFNKIKRKIGQIDTIRVFKKKNVYSVYYKNKELGVKKRFVDEKKLIKMYGHKAHTSIYLYFETFEEDNRSQRITIFNHYINSENNYIKIENFENEIISGLYRELTLEYEPRIIGNYILKDSLYNDTLRIFDSETYEESIKIIKRNKVPVKCGEWIYFNEEGESEKTNHIRNCK